MFATLADVLARYPNEATILAADETTRERDDARIEAALTDAAAEIRVILFARYTRADLDRIDDDSREALRIYAIDIALYRVALAFGRGNDRVKDRYDIAIKRLEAIGAGKASLSFDGPGGGGAGGGGSALDPSSVGPAEAIVEAPERLFTRERLRGL
ncbi:phage protein Gp36 family protein [Ancylobacter sp. G4_0304]|uniref:phage protein Gp36 family protein n=1 Tax=Ancylobacter sp. G4_0304 TaxID=3114289 RepID=UPI0039C5C828